MVEDRFTALYKDYEAELKEIEAEYMRRFDNLPVNEAGETYIEDLTELNEWNRKRILEAQDAYIKLVLQEGDDEKIES